MAASKGPATPAVGPAGVLVSAVRKKRPSGGWLAAVLVPVPARAPTVAVVAKEPAAGPMGALAPAAMERGPTERWGCAAVPAGAPAAMMAPTARSWEAAAVT
jgi:hypothetical protein